MRRPWLARKFDATLDGARRKVPEICDKVLIGVLVAVLTMWILRAWIAVG